MIGVIDASGATEILLQKEKVNTFRNILEESSFILAPDVYVSELANTFWKYFTAKNLSEKECIQYIQLGIGYVDRFIDCKDMWEEAFSEGVINNHSIYDMFYMVTARRNNGILITNDAVLARICGKNKVQICY